MLSCNLENISLGMKPTVKIWILFKILSYNKFKLDVWLWVCKQKNISKNVNIHSKIASAVFTAAIHSVYVHLHNKL